MMAVRLAVPKLTSEDLAAMEQLIEEMATRAELGDVAGFFEANTEFHQRFFEVADNRMLAELYRQLRGQIDRHRLRSLELRGDLRRSIAEHRSILSAAETGDVELAVHLTSDHIRVPQIRARRGSRARVAGREVEMSAKLEFGVNLNNREPLIAPDYDLKMLLDLSEVVESSGFDSVWVGDSLFSKPRYEPIALLAAISQRTSRVKLGTACMVTSTRNPLYLALEWATLDQLSGGRTILGAGGQSEEGRAPRVRGARARPSERGSVFERPRR
jgi:hypothetical protein